jgi:hypothetical protein
MKNSIKNLLVSSLDTVEGIAGSPRAQASILSVLGFFLESMR